METEMELQVALSVSDRTQPIITGAARPPGFRLTCAAASVEEIFVRQVSEAAFDVAELSLASYLTALGRGEQRLSAIPVFLSRAFRHNALYVRADSDIHDLSALRGRRFGLPEYQMTAAVWVRALLRDADLANDDLQWLTYRPERVPVPVPATRGQASDVFEALVTGEVDVIMSARRPPERYFPRTGAPGTMRRLFDHPWDEERAYVQRTGVFPIMHLVSVRRDTIRQHPDLPRALYHLFERVKNDAVDRLTETVILSATLPWAVESAEVATRLMNDDPWPYGLASNRRQIETFIAYLREDGLLDRPLSLEDVFDASTMDL